MNRVVARLLTADGRTILSNSSYFVAATAATAGLGFAYWWLAARQFSPHEVGLAAAAVSAMALLGNVAMLGFGTLLIAELHRQRDRAAAYVASALLVSCLAGAALGAGALVLAPWALPELASFAGDIGGIVLFTLGVALTAASLVADDALIGLFRGRARFVRNAVFAVTKLAVLAAAAVALGGASGVTIFGAWVAGLLVSMLVIVALGLRHNRRARHYRPDAEVLHHLGRSMFQHHALNMAVLVPGLALPVIVATALSPSEAGYFYVALMIAGIVSIAAPALGITLFAVGARSPSGLPHAMRLTLVLSFLITGAGCAVVILAGRPLLSTFGPGYAAEGTVPLIVLTLATLPGIIKVHFIQVYRIRGRIAMAAAIAGAGAVLELSAAAIGARQGGLVGLSVGFALATLLEALAMSPLVVGAARLWPGTSRPVGHASINGMQQPNTKSDD